MPINWNVVATIAGPTIALFIGAVLSRILERKPKLNYYLGNVSAFRLRTVEGGQLNTHNLIISNTGRKTAENIRIGHMYLPNDFNIYPRKEYDVIDIPENGKEILIKSLVPQEMITISYMYFPPLTYNQINTTVMHDDGFAKMITVFPTRQFPMWQLRIFGVLFLLGIIFANYLLYEIFSRLIGVLF